MPVAPNSERLTDDEVILTIIPECSYLSTKKLRVKQINLIKLLVHRCVWKSTLSHVLHIQKLLHFDFTIASFRFWWIEEKDEKNLKSSRDSELSLNHCILLFMH